MGKEVLKSWSGVRPVITIEGVCALAYPTFRLFESFWGNWRSIYSTVTFRGKYMTFKQSVKAFKLLAMVNKIHAEIVNVIFFTATQSQL